VVDRERSPQPFLGGDADRIHRPGIVDQDVDARLLRCDFARNAPGFGKARQVGIVHDMPDAGRQGLQLRERRRPARPVACDQDQARPRSREAPRGNLSNAGGRSGDDNDFALDGLAHRCSPLPIDFACATIEA
jgi:hypothetical protein